MMGAKNGMSSMIDAFAREGFSHGAKPCCQELALERSRHMNTVGGLPHGYGIDLDVGQIQWQDTALNYRDRYCFFHPFARQRGKQEQVSKPPDDPHGA